MHPFPSFERENAAVQREAPDHERERRVVEELALGLERQVDARRPLRHAVPGVRDLGERLGHAERRDGEVVALQAQDREAEEDRDERREERAGRERGEERDVPLAEHEEARRVGADPEVRDVAERRVPRVAADEVPALRHESEDEEARVRQELVARDELRQGDEEREEDAKAPTRRRLSSNALPGDALRAEDEKEDEDSRT